MKAPIPALVCILIFYSETTRGGRLESKVLQKPMKQSAACSGLFLRAIPFQEASDVLLGIGISTLRKSFRKPINQYLIIGLFYVALLQHPPHGLGEREWNTSIHLALLPDYNQQPPTPSATLAFPFRMGYTSKPRAKASPPSLKLLLSGPLPQQ